MHHDESASPVPIKAAKSKKKSALHLRRADAVIVSAASLAACIMYIILEILTE